jgi:hypothetical protein
MIAFSFSLAKQEHYRLCYESVTARAVRDADLLNSATDIESVEPLVTKRPKCYEPNTPMLAVVVKLDGFSRAEK